MVLNESESLFKYMRLNRHGREVQASGAVEIEKWIQSTAAYLMTQ